MFRRIIELEIILTEWRANIWVAVVCFNIKVSVKIILAMPTGQNTEAMAVKLFL